MMRARLAALALLLTPGPAWTQSGQPTNFFSPLKDIPIGGDARLSFSGELRERFESYTSPAFGLRGFTLDQIKEHHYKLDGFKWLRDDEAEDPDDLPEPEGLVA